MIGHTLDNPASSVIHQQTLPFIVPRCEERISGFIENHCFTSTEHVIEKYSDGYRENINLFVSKPFKMTQGKYYRMGIKIRKAGWYNAGMFDYDSLIYKSLKFDFQKSETEEMSFICGIIFKM